MEVQEFRIYKYSGTYSETLEAYGVANLLNEISTRCNKVLAKVSIEDNDLFYTVKTNKPITSEMIDSLEYFPIVKFIKKDLNTVVPKGIIDFFDYPDQKRILDEYKEQFKSIDTNSALTTEQKKQAKKNLNQKRLSEFGYVIKPEFDVFREIKGNPYASFLKLFDNFFLNQDDFATLIKEVLSYYSQIDFGKRDFGLTDEKPTAQQLYNPNQGKGLNKGKANNASMGNLSSSWISETMKISGSLSMMICQYVKVGSAYDLKIYVPEFHQIGLSKAKEVIFEFKRYLKSSSPIKLDILNSINLSISFIQQTPEYNRGKIKNTVKGFHSVYQKDLGQNKAVVNIAFINTPDFISYFTREEGKDWIEILEDQRRIISGIEELGDSIQGLQAFRDFLGNTGKSAFENFNKFSFWYGGYLMQSLSNEKYYVKPFNTETLNKFYINMDTKGLNLKEIIENEGFKAVAKAIRKSTVSLQYTPKDQRKFEIRYGFAQQLQNKSKSKEDLATFIGEFIGFYNAETASYVDKLNKNPKATMHQEASSQSFTGEKLSIAPRATVKDSELNEFFEILNQQPSRLIGALLASYGFALTTKENPIVEDEESSDDLPE